MGLCSFYICVSLLLSFWQQTILNITHSGFTIVCFTMSESVNAMESILFAIQTAYWVLLTCIVVLQPNSCQEIHLKHHRWPTKSDIMNEVVCKEVPYSGTINCSSVLPQIFGDFPKNMVVNKLIRLNRLFQLGFHILPKGVCMYSFVYAYTNDTFRL